MPITLTLVEELAPGLWKAEGEYVGRNMHRDEVSSDASLLLKADGNSLTLHLDSSVHRSVILGRTVGSYTDAQTKKVKKVEAGVTVKFSKQQFGLLNK